MIQNKAQAGLVVALAAAGLTLGLAGEAVAVERCGDVRKFKATNLKVKQVPCGKGRTLVKVWFYEMPANANKFHCNPSPLGTDNDLYRVRCANDHRVVRWVQEDLR